VSGLDITAVATEEGFGTAIDNVTIAALENLPPQVEVVPVVTEFTLGSTIPVVADAGDIDGEVVQVDFFANNVLIGTAGEAGRAFLVDWRPTVAATYTLKAVATDNSDSRVTKTSERVWRESAIRIGLLSRRPSRCSNQVTPMLIDRVTPMTRRNQIDHSPAVLCNSLQKARPRRCAHQPPLAPRRKSGPAKPSEPAVGERSDNVVDRSRTRNAVAKHLIPAARAIGLQVLIVWNLWQEVPIRHARQNACRTRMIDRPMPHLGDRRRIASSHTRRGHDTHISAFARLKRLRQVV